MNKNIKILPILIAFTLASSLFADAPGNSAAIRITVPPSDNAMASEQHEKRVVRCGIPDGKQREGDYLALLKDAVQVDVPRGETTVMIDRTKLKPAVLRYPLTNEDGSVMVGNRFARNKSPTTKEGLGFHCLYGIYWDGKVVSGTGISVGESVKAIEFLPNPGSGPIIKKAHY